MYDDAVQALKLPTVMNLSRFLLPDDHEYVKAFMLAKKKKQLRSAQLRGMSRKRFEHKGQAAKEVGQTVAYRPLEASPQIWHASGH